MLGGLAVVGAFVAREAQPRRCVDGRRTSERLRGGRALQAHALACSNLGHAEPGTPEWFTLTTMESQLANEHAKHSQLDDRKSATRDQLDQKLKTVRTAITSLAERVSDHPASLAAELAALPAGPSPQSQRGADRSRPPVSDDRVIGMWGELQPTASPGIGVYDRSPRARRK